MSQEPTPKKETVKESKLKCAHGLGHRSIQGRAIQHLDDDQTIIYQIGQHITRYNYDKRSHKFLLKSHSVFEIICFCVSKGRKYIALSEETYGKRKGEKFQVSVYELAVAKTAMPFRLETNKSYVSCMDFSRDSRYLVGSTNSPENGIYIWNLNAKKRIGYTKVKKFEPFQVLFNPFNLEDIQISALSKKECRVFQFEDNELRNFNPLNGVKYTYLTHSWYDDESFLVGTKEGDILVVEKFKLVKTIKNVFQNTLGIYVIQAIERGFLCGGESGNFSVFERSYKNNYFQQYKLFQTKDKSRITDLCVSKREENVVCCCENNQMILFHLSNLDILKDTENNFKILPTGFHSELVTGVDVCVQKSLIITCDNNTIRMWNYLKRTVELTKKFNKDIYSVSLHPNGFQILIGFRYNLSLYSIVNNDLYKCCEWLFKGCKCVKFSNGGSYFAATISTNIVIVSTITFQPVITLRGHNGIVKDLVWGENDLTMTTAGYEGAIYGWDIFSKEKKRIEENIVKTCSFHSCFTDEENRICGGIGNDKKLWYFTENNEINISLNVILSSVALSKKNGTLFLGTQDGKILLYKWPLPDKSKESGKDRECFREYQMHLGKVVKLVLSYEEQYLFSVGEDGALIQMEIITTEDNRLVLRKGFEKLAKLDDLTFIMKSTLIEHQNNVSSLEEKMHQVMLDAERQVSSVIEDKRKHTEKTKKDNDNKIKLLKREINELKQQAMENETAAKHRLNAMEAAHLKKVGEFNKHYEKRLDLEEKRYNKLLEKLQEENSNFQDTIKNLKNSHKLMTEKLRSEYSNDKQQQIRAFNQLGIEFEEMRETYKEMKRQSDEDYNQQLDNQRGKFEEEIEKHVENEEENKKKELVQKSEVANMKQQIKEKNVNIEKLKNEARKKADRIAQQTKKIQTLQEDLREKENSQNTSEKKLQEQKSEICDLEKLRYVLTFKYQSLQKEVAPKENMITSMKKQLKGMDNELTEVAAEKESLKKKLKSKDETLEVLRKNIEDFKTNIQVKNRKFKVMVKELQSLTEDYNMNEPKKIMNRVKKIIAKFLQKKQHLEGKFGSNRGSRIHEFERQRDHNEQKISTLKETLMKKESISKHEINRKTRENAVLVGEVNILRREKKVNEKKIRDLNVKLRTLNQQLLLLQRGLTSQMSPNGTIQSHKRIRPEDVQKLLKASMTPEKRNFRRRRKPKARPVTTGVTKTLPKIRREVDNRPMSTGYGYDLYGRGRTPESVYSLNETSSSVKSYARSNSAKGRLIKGSVFSKKNKS